MFLNLLGIVRLLTAIFYIGYHTLRTPVYSYSPNQTSATNQTIEPSPSPDVKKTISYSGFCLNVPILMYHHVQPADIAKEKWQTNFTVNNDVFENQMAYLTNSGYTTISLEQLAQALINKQSLPPKSIALTFDDGYADIHSYAFPILQKYQLRANLLVSTGLLNNSD